jgi:hypothetical protein
MIDILILMLLSFVEYTDIQYAYTARHYLQLHARMSVAVIEQLLKL